MRVMKKKLFNCSVLLLVLLNTMVFANDHSTEKKKIINKNYKANSNEKLNIENQFGKVTVETWDRSEIDVEITITVNSKSESKSLEILDDIKINENTAGASVYLKTVLPSSKYNTGKQSMTIDYLVKMPVNSPLNIQNKFGSVYLGDFKSNLQLNVSYGSIKINKLIGDNKRVQVNFGSADINYIDDIDLESKYSKLNIEKIIRGEIRNQFGKTYINEAGDIRVTQKYGDLDLRKVNTITAQIEFCNIDIDALGKNADLNLKYSGNADLGIINSTVDLLKVNASFSTLHLKFAENTDLDFNAHLKYGDLKINNVKISDYMKNVDESSSQKTYKGKIGKGGRGNLILDSNYSTIYFQ